MWRYKNLKIADDFVKPAKKEMVGPHGGAGAITVTIRDDRHLLVNLNPDVEDHNVFLELVATRSGYSGQWTYYTEAGKTAAYFVCIE